MFEDDPKKGVRTKKKILKAGGETEGAEKQGGGGAWGGGVREGV